MHVHWHKPYPKFQFAIDGLSLWGIWKAAESLRIWLNPVMKLKLTSQDSEGWVPSLAVVTLLWLAASWRFRLYRPPAAMRLSAVLRWAATETIAVVGVTILSVFFSRQFGEGASRMFVFCMLPSSFVIFVSTRLAAAALMRKSQIPRIALIGDRTTADYLLSRFEQRVASAVRGVIIPEAAAAAAAVGHSGPILATAAPALRRAPSQEQIQVLGTIGQIAELINREQIERVIVIGGSLTDSELERCNKVFWRMGLPVSHTLGFPLGPDPVPMRSRHRLNLSNQKGLSIVEIRPARVQPTQDFFKHLLDLGLALGLLLVLWPLLIGIAIAIRVGSRGSVLDPECMVGKGGRYFTCLKFRTTHRENDPALEQVRKGGALWLQPDDYVTSIGRFLRRYGLDELPQLLNILAGRMSFVGPRPLPARALGPDGMSREFYKWSETRARVRPGLTGLWQVSGRSNLSFEEMIHLDLEYVQTRSLWRDFEIMLQTPGPLLRGVGGR